MSVEEIGALTDEEKGLSPKLHFGTRKIEFKIGDVIFKLEVFNPGYDEISSRGKNAKIELYSPSNFLFFKYMKKQWSTRKSVKSEKIGEYQYLKNVGLELLEQFKVLKMQEIIGK